MKKILKLAAVAASVIAVFSCQKEVEQVTEPQAIKSFTFNVAHEGVDTKSSLNDEHTAFQWDGGENIGVYFYESYSDGNANLKSPVTTKGTTATITVTPVAKTCEGDKILGYFPYCENAYAIYSGPFAAEVILPAEQNGESIVNAMPMFSKPIVIDEEIASEQTMLFKNLAGVLEFNVYSTNATYQSEVVKSVKFQKDGVSGTFYIDLTATKPALYGNIPSETDAVTATVTTEKLVVSQDAGEKTLVYMVVAPGTYSEATVTVTTNKAIYTATLPESLPLTVVENKVIPFNVNLGNTLFNREERSRYTVTFDSGSGTCATTSLQEAEAGAGITLPVATPVGGWIFAGWAESSCDTETETEPTYVTLVDEKYYPTSNTTLYAVYKQAVDVGAYAYLTNAEIQAARSKTGYNSGYVDNAVIESAGGNWGGYCAFQLNKGDYTLQINKNTNGYHLSSATYPADVVSVTIDCSSAKQTTNVGRKFYICSSNSDAQPSSGDLGLGSLPSDNGSVTIPVAGNTTHFYVYSDGTAYINHIDVKYVNLIYKYHSNPTKPTVSTPIFSVVAGTYDSAQNVTISCTTDGASIYYTTDGTEPTASSTKYSSAIEVSANTTIKAIAIKDGYDNSEVVEAAYVFKTATPVFSVAAGTYDSTQSVELGCTTEGANIYYTTDGTEPTASSTLYSSAIEVNANTTIKAIAIKDGYDNSEVVEAAYEFKTATPVFSVAAGTYNSTQNVELSCTTEGASIYYTTDGTEPSTSSTPYTSAIEVSENTTIKAIAIKEGYTNSDVAEATYVINTGAVVVYSKITSDAELEEGEYIITAEYNNKVYALPAAPTVSSGKVTGVEITVSDNTISESNAAGYVWTFTKSGDYFIIGDGTKYIYHSNGGASGTDLAYGTSQASYPWSISWDSTNSGFKFAGVVASSSSVKTRGMLFATSSLKFGGYALSNAGSTSYYEISLFKKSYK